MWTLNHFQKSIQAKSWLELKCILFIFSVLFYTVIVIYIVYKYKRYIISLQGRKSTEQALFTVTVDQITY